MADRHISAAEIDAVIQSPEQKVPGKKGRTIHQSRIRGGTLLLRLIIDDSTEVATVVTIYPSSRISRYWRKDT